MKKISLLIMAVLCLGVLPMSAQHTRHNGEEPSLKEKAQTAWQNARDKVNKTTSKIKDKLGIDDQAHIEKRVKYMPIYTEDEYKSHDSETLKQPCREKLLQLYPHMAIKSTVIPMEEWESTPLEENGSVKGYVQTLRVYVLAKDGTDGYVNAEFTYQRFKYIGGVYNHVQDKWPECTRVDIIPKADFKLIKR